MPEPINLIYLDRYHLDDPLYVPGLARIMGRWRRPLPPCLFVHGSGEQAERALEAEGLFPERRDGLVQVRTPQEAALVERALRQVNRRLVGAFTDEGVHAVGFQGMDRGLLALRPDGSLATGRLGWLRELVVRRGVPVVSTLVRDASAGRVREVEAATATLALARAFADHGVVVVFFTRTNQPGVVEDGRPLPACSFEMLPAPVLPDPEALRRVAAAGFSMLLTSAPGLFGSAEPQGTRIFN